MTKIEIKVLATNIQNTEDMGFKYKKQKKHKEACNWVAKNTFGSGKTSTFTI